ncbi:hypothetical protein SAMN04487764_1833 [Gillisia sp. Hel1_33_143]|uniref:hypothetical protein n=1 Tax=unclassified Gillisia TaxID=2615025 RepID=UPI00087B3D14|nr:MULTISPECIES: hypothetical protein [unclassified Gillisia]SDS27100.1 hypothetical protein SAMN04487764_1833 [Gillisia sp. Hel1_33_143]
MNKTRFLIIIVMFYNITLISQNVTYNHLVDSSNVKTQEVIRLIENYIKSEPNKLGFNQFWNEEDQRNYEHYDFLESEFKPSLYMDFPIHVLSVKSNNDIYQLKAQYSFCQENGTPYVLAIVNYYAKPENGSYKLYNALIENRKKWNYKKVGLIDYYFPKYHEFNMDKAEIANDFIHEISKIFDVKPIPFEYYMADDYDEIQNLKGIDYYIGMGGANMPSGKSSFDKIYGSGLGEDYLHEIYHVQIDQHYPNKNYWITEGLATYLSNSSRGKSLKWHQEKIYNYLKKNPNVNLNNLTDYVNFDQYTDYHYALGSFLIKKIYEKGGWKMIKEMMNSGTSNEEFYAALENCLGIAKSDLNEYIRENLKLEFE